MAAGTENIGHSRISRELYVYPVYEKPVCLSLAKWSTRGGRQCRDVGFDPIFSLLSLRTYYGMNWKSGQILHTLHTAIAIESALPSYRTKNLAGLTSWARYIVSKSMGLLFVGTDAEVKHHVAALRYDHRYGE